MADESRREKDERIVIGKKTWPPGTPDEVIREFKDEVARALIERGVDPGIVKWDDG